MTRAAIAAAFLAGCLAPRPLGLARISVCALAEQSRTDYMARPTLSRGASVCADFEPEPDPDPPAAAAVPEVGDAGAAESEDE